MHAYTQNNVPVSMHTRECLHTCIMVTRIPCTLLTNEKARTCVTWPPKEKATFDCKDMSQNLVSFVAFPSSRKLPASAPASGDELWRRCSCVFYHLINCFCSDMTYISLDRRQQRYRTFRIRTKRSEIDFEQLLLYLCLSFS